MRREINVHGVTERLTTTFRRYLYTTNLVADSEPELRRAVFAALGERDVFVRGPFVSAIPAYSPAATGAELMGRAEPPRLHPRHALRPEPDRHDAAALPAPGRCD